LRFLLEVEKKNLNKMLLLFTKISTIKNITEFFRTKTNSPKITFSFTLQCSVNTLYLTFVLEKEPF
jgi:hypothetical protein